jgi:hypothetical protein
VACAAFVPRDGGSVVLVEHSAVLAVPHTPGLPWLRHLCTFI